MSLTLRTAVPALLLASNAVIALAQPPAAEKSSAPSAAATAVAPQGAAMAPGPSAAATASAGALRYQSAFEGYRRLTDQAVSPWRESNDLVGRIGGWQSYAREGQGSAPAGTADAPVKTPASRPDPANTAAPPKAATAPAAASAAMPSGHTGHKQP